MKARNRIFALITLGVVAATMMACSGEDKVVIYCGDTPNPACPTQASRSATATPIIVANPTQAPAAATTAPTTSVGSGTTPPPAAANNQGNRVAQLSAADVASTGSMPNLPRDVSHGAWEIHTTGDLAATDPIIDGWIARLKDPAPGLWPTFPNIPNPMVPEFRVVNGDQVPDGAEDGVANVPFCQQDMRCDFVVPAGHYRLITADYVYRGVRCAGGGGCLLLLLNEGGESHTDVNQIADNGFTVPGRYWNGDTLEWAAWGLVSHAAANMLNMPTMASPDKVLNAGGSSANAGANCGVPNACQDVKIMIVIKTGDAVKAVLTSHVNVTSAARGW